MEKLKVTPVLLPTKTQSNIQRAGNRGRIQYFEDSDIHYIFGTIERLNSQHLYFVSEEKIKEGDWIIVKHYTGIFKVIFIEKDKTNFQITAVMHGDTNKITYNLYESKKIESTTNKSLNIPLIPENWIEEVYIPKQGNVGDIYLEMEDSGLAKAAKKYTKDYEWEGFKELKLTKNNEVVILPNEEKMFTREDMQKCFWAGAEWHLDSGLTFHQFINKYY